MKKIPVIRHKSSGSEVFTDKYFTLKNNSNLNSQNPYDSSLDMIILESALNKTNLEIEKMKKQIGSNHFEPKKAMSQEHRGCFYDSSNILRNKAMNQRRNSCSKKNSALLQILLRNVSNQKFLKGKYNLQKMSESKSKLQQDPSLGLVTKRQELKLPIDNSSKEEWRNNEKRRLFHVSQLREYIHTTYQSRQHQETSVLAKRAKKKPFPSLPEAQLEQCTRIFREHPTKKSSTTPILIKKHPLARTQTEVPLALDNKFHKPVVLTRRAIQTRQKVKKSQVPQIPQICMVPLQKEAKQINIRESLMIEPWGTQIKALISEELIPSWQTNS